MKWERRCAMDGVTQLVGFWFTVGLIAWMLGGQRWGGAVFAAPLRWFGQAVRAALGVAGRGIVRLIADAHRYFMRRWPGWTLLGYAAILVLLAVIGYLAG